MTGISAYVIPWGIVFVLTLIMLTAHIFINTPFWNFRFDHTLTAIIVYVIVDFIYVHVCNFMYISTFLLRGILLLSIGSETSVIFEKGYHLNPRDIIPIGLYILISYIILKIALMRKFKYIRTLVVGLISNVIYFIREIKDWQSTDYISYDIDGYIYPMFMIIICGIVHVKCFIKQKHLPI